MAFKLTFADAVKAAKERFKAGTLTAQAERVEDRYCAYRIRGYRCAIGAALPTEVLNKLAKRRIHGASMNEKSVESLIEHGFLEVPAEDELPLRQLQATHDEWCRYAGSDEISMPAAKVEGAKLRFMAMLGMK
jgi:hypothetical protein